jgi:phenylacetate-CoA ligase
VIVEIVRPGTGDPVAEGEVGELVVTTLNPDYPLIRSAPATSRRCCPGAARPAAPTSASAAGSGRADQSAKVRGMFVHPPQVAEIARRHPEVRRRGWSSAASGRRPDVARGRGRGAAPEGLAERIAGTIREVTKLRGEVAVRAGQPAERRQGDRGHAQVRLSGAGARLAARRRVSCRP